MSSRDRNREIGENIPCGNQERIPKEDTEASLKLRIEPGGQQKKKISQLLLSVNETKQGAC
jgi:hypothetical protein